MSLQENRHVGADQPHVVDWLGGVVVQPDQGGPDACTMDLAAEEGRVSPSAGHPHEAIARAEAHVEDEASEGAAERAREVQHATEVQMDAIIRPVLLDGPPLGPGHGQLTVPVPLLRQRRAPRPELPSQSSGDALVLSRTPRGRRYGEEEQRGEEHCTCT